MKNSHGFWTYNFHKACGRFDKKEHFETVSVFGWKKTYLIINLVALIMMFFMLFLSFQKSFLSRSLFKLKSLANQSQKNFDCVALPYREKNRNFDKKFLDKFLSGNVSVIDLKLRSHSSEIGVSKKKRWEPVWEKTTPSENWGHICA